MDNLEIPPYEEPFPEDWEYIRSLEESIDLIKPRPLPPLFLSGEQLIIGTYLINPKLMNNFNQTKLRKFFYDLRHQAIHERLQEISIDKVNLNSLEELLRNNQQLEAIGGHNYLQGLVNAAKYYQVSNCLPHIISILENLYLRRQKEL